MNGLTSQLSTAFGFSYFANSSRTSRNAAYSATAPVTSSSTATATGRRVVGAVVVTPT